MSRKGQITITSVANTAKYFFKNSTGSYVASGIPDTELNPSDTSTYGFNSLLAPAAFKIQYNKIPFIELTSVTNNTTNTQDNTLRFYSSSTTTKGPRAMELTNNELAFYNIDSNNDKVASLSTNGLILTSGGIIAGTAGQNGYVYLSSENNTNSITINGHTPTQNDPKWRQVVGTKFGVDSEGNLYANNVNISGVIKVATGSNVYSKNEADTAFDAAGSAANAQQAAIAAAATDATQKADNAQTAAIASAQQYTNAATSSLATKTTAVKRSQVIYYRTNQTPSTWVLPTTWVDPASPTTVNSWTTQVPPLADNINIGTTPYPYLYTITQIEYNDGRIGCSSTTPSLDNTTTVIDGGKIITNSVTAEKIHVTDLNALNATIGNISISNHNLNISEEYEDATHSISRTMVERFGLGRDANDSNVYYIKMGATPTSVEQDNGTYAAEAPNIFYVNSNGILNIGKGGKGISYNLEEDKLNINVSNITLNSGNNLEDEIAQMVDASIDDTLLYDAQICFSYSDSFPQNPVWYPYTVTQETNDSWYDLAPLTAENETGEYDNIEFTVQLLNTQLYYRTVNNEIQYYYYVPVSSTNEERIWPPTEGQDDPIFGSITTEFTETGSAQELDVITKYNNLTVESAGITEEEKIYRCGAIVDEYKDGKSLYAFLKFYPTQAIDEKGLVWTYDDMSTAVDASDNQVTDYSTENGGTFTCGVNQYQQSLADNFGEVDNVNHLANIVAINNSLTQYNVWQDWLGVDLVIPDLEEEEENSVTVTKGYWYETLDTEEPFGFTEIESLMTDIGIAIPDSSSQNTYKCYVPIKSNEEITGWTEGYTITVNPWSNNKKIIDCVVPGTQSSQNLSFYYQLNGDEVEGPFVDYSAEQSTTTVRLILGAWTGADGAEEVALERGANFENIFLSSTPYVIDDFSDNFTIMGGTYYYYQTTSLKTDQKVYEDYYPEETELGDIVYKTYISSDNPAFYKKQARVKGINSNVNSLINSIQINPDDPSITLVAGAVSDISLRITNDRISFVHSYDDNGVQKAEEVAYMSGTNGGKLYIQDAEILNDLQVRDFEITSSSEGDFIIRGAS